MCLARLVFDRLQEAISNNLLPTDYANWTVCDPPARDLDPSFYEGRGVEFWLARTSEMSLQGIFMIKFICILLVFLLPFNFFFFLIICCYLLSSVLSLVKTGTESKLFIFDKDFAVADPGGPPP